MTMIKDFSKKKKKKKKIIKMVTNIQYKTNK